MRSDRGVLWTLAREPEGPLAAYLDQFASLLDGQGFKRRGFGQQIRAVARFSRWLQLRQVVAAAVTEEHARCFLADPAEQGFVRQGVAATLRRLLDFLRQLEVCGPIPAPDAPTPVQQTITAYGEYLQKELGLSAKTLVQYCSFAEPFLFEHYGSGPVDLARLRGADVIEYYGDKRLASVQPEARQRQLPCVPFSATSAIAAEHSLIWPARCQPWLIGR